MFKQILAITLASVAMVANSSVPMKTFNITALDSTVTTLQYPWQQASECFYDQRRDVLTCVENYPYLNVTSLWKEDPKSILYISVNCLTRGQYRRSACVCKNSGSSSNDVTQPDTYTPCQLNNLDEGILRSLTNLEVLDLSFNRIENVSKRAFTFLRKLRYLSLSKNNIKEIPSGFLCQVTGLEYLGFSELMLNSYPDQSFRCKKNFTNLRVMDIRGNAFTDIPEDALDQLPALESLDLSFNSLTEIKKKAFSGSNLLQFLDLSHCNISKIFPFFCNYLPHISLFYLHDNVFEAFDFTLIEKCSSLIELDLSSNVITTLSGNISALESLTSLNLANNNIKSLNVTLEGLANLSSLVLFNNSIDSLQRKNFVGLTNLEILNLSRNHISQSEDMETIFRDIESLQTLDLSFNNLAGIPNNSFSHLNQLKRLLLDHNQLENVNPMSFYGLNTLNVLALDNNRLQALPDDIFFPFVPRDGVHGNGVILSRLTLSYNNFTDLSNVNKWPEIISLCMAYNKLTTVPSAIGYSRMKLLNVSHNKLESFFGKQENIAADFAAMETMDISYNTIKDIDVDKLKTMTNVEYFNIESNNVTFAVTNETFRGMDNLIRLNLAHNNIQYIDGIFSDQSLHNLTFLNLSRNPLQYVGDLSERFNGSALEVIDLSECNLKTIRPNTFRGLLKLSNVYLNGNLIETFPPLFAHATTKYNFIDNPVVCACNMSWLRETYVKDTASGARVLVANYKVPKCSVYTETVLSYPYKLLRRQFMCPEVDGCHALCKCFKTEQNGNITVVKCRNGLRSVPNVSTTALAIFLDGNNFNENTSLSAFLDMSNMTAKELYLNKSLISSLDSKYFVGFEYLEILDLSNNLIKVLPSGVFKSQTMLKQLYLSDNILTTIQANVFQNLFSLRELDLSGNKLAVLSQDTVTELSDLDYIKYYFLARNQWACDCSNLGFKDLVDDILSKIRDRKFLVCGGDSTKKIRYLPRSEFLCSDEESQQSSKQTLIIIVIVVICVLLLLVAVLVYFRRELLSLLYYKTGCHIPGKHRYSGVHFDAYLSYDPSDQHCASYVHNTLMPKLNNNAYNVQTSSDVIQDLQVTKKIIEDSRCSIFIVDKNFSTNSFLVKVFLIATARHKMEKRHSVILIIHGDIDLLTLEPELVSRMRKGDYITARSRLWWQRLVYELPKSSSGFQHGVDSEDEDVVVFSSLAEDQSQYEQF